MNASIPELSPADLQWWSRQFAYVRIEHFFSDRYLLRYPSGEPWDCEHQYTIPNLAFLKAWVAARPNVFPNVTFAC